MGIRISLTNQITQKNTTAYLNLLEELALTQAQIIGDLGVFKPLITALGGFSNDIDSDRLNLSIHLDICRCITIVKSKKANDSNLLMKGLWYLLKSGEDLQKGDRFMSTLKSGNPFDKLDGNLLKKVSNKTEFTLLPLLADLNYHNLNLYVTFLHRVGMVMTKADNIISSDEKYKLQRLFQHLQQYLNDKSIVKNVQSNIPITGKSEQTLIALEEQLESLIGLDSVKKEISDIKNYILVQKARKESWIKNFIINASLCLYR